MGDDELDLWFPIWLPSEPEYGLDPWDFEYLTQPVDDLDWLEEHERWMENLDDE
jgi:hypothetical protein